MTKTSYTQAPRYGVHCADMTQTDENVPDTPPMTLFFGLGYVKKGIMRVAYDLGDKELNAHMDQWDHYTGNSPEENDTPEKKERAEVAISAAEKVITEKMGFTPREIKDTALTLQNDYKGACEAPFEFELY